MDKLVNRVVKILERNNAIAVDNVGVVRYGMELLFFKIIFYVVVLFIGVIANRVLHMVIFMLFFEPLRIYAGGFHAKSRLNCFFISFIMLVAAVSAIRFTPSVYYSLLSAIFTIVFGIIIWLIAPVETDNKTLDETETRVYRKRTRLILLFEIAVIVIGFIFKQYWLSYIISLGLLCSGFLLITGYCCNNISRIKSKEVECEK